MQHLTEWLWTMRKRKSRASQASWWWPLYAKFWTMRTWRGCPQAPRGQKHTRIWSSHASSRSGSTMLTPPSMLLTTTPSTQGVQKCCRPLRDVVPCGVASILGRWGNFKRPVYDFDVSLYIKICIRICTKRFWAHYFFMLHASICKLYIKRPYLSVHEFIINQMSFSLLSWN